MRIRWNRIETWLALFVAGIGAILLLVAGLWVYISATTKPLHPTAHDVQSVADTAPEKTFADSIERARQIVREQVAAQNLPGLSVAVGVDGHIAWAEGFGWADIEHHTPVTPKTRFRIGTASIPLTSAAVGLLLERNKLNLDATIQTYVPEFPQKRWPVTLRQLMAHTAGLSSDGGDEGPLFGTHCDRAVDAFPAFANRDLRFEPGTQYYYSRFSWIPVSAAIESAGGDTLARFMRKEIFEPLAMHDTIADPSNDAASPDRATSYFPRFASDTRYGPDVMRPLDYSCYAGSSVFVSTPSDLVRFAMAMSGGTLLQPATVQLLQASQYLPSGAETGYGLGWDLEKVTLSGRPVTMVGHDGDLLGGIAASLISFHDSSLIVALTSNTSYADTPAIGMKIAEVFAPRQP